MRDRSNVAHLKLCAVDMFFMKKEVSPPTDYLLDITSILNYKYKKETTDTNKTIQGFQLMEFSHDRIAGT
jgi:hypothetical protein